MAGKKSQLLSCAPHPPGRKLGPLELGKGTRRHRKEALGSWALLSSEHPSGLIQKDEVGWYSVVLKEAHKMCVCVCVVQPLDSYNTKSILWCRLQATSVVPGFIPS